MLKEIFFFSFHLLLHMNIFRQVKSKKSPYSELFCKPNRLQKPRNGYFVFYKFRHLVTFETLFKQNILSFLSLIYETQPKTISYFQESILLRSFLNNKKEFPLDF